ncbi:MULTISPECIES: short chain dehydrogenase [unclassified Agarivorans]|uniref:short chain dehydrogenase n=1 Tax=unclassified Agarivorans TaxID=2636026 RepID=UPI003D7CCE16
MNKTAIVIGATGLVGLALVKQLLADPQWAKVKVFSRRSMDLNSSKLDLHVVDFTQLPIWQSQIKGHSLFICLGTTLRQAGSRAAMRQIDYELPLDFSIAAKRNGIEDCLLISSRMANPASVFHYLRIKGELEQALTHLLFKRLMIFRPGPLLGQRREPRTSEQLVAVLQPLFRAQYSPFRAWRGTSANSLARCMLRHANDTAPQQKQIFQGEALY